MNWANRGKEARCPIDPLGLGDQPNRGRSTSITTQTDSVPKRSLMDGLKEGLYFIKYDLEGENVLYDPNHIEELIKSEKLEVNNYLSSTIFNNIYEILLADFKENPANNDP